MQSRDATVTISLNGEFTAIELEEIIRDLAHARAGMTPSVPTSLAGAVLVNATSLIEQTPNFQLSTLVDGGLRIHLRSSGLGWLAFQLDAAQTSHMVELITHQVPDRPRPQ